MISDIPFLSLDFVHGIGDVFIFNLWFCLNGSKWQRIDPLKPNKVDYFVDLHQWKKHQNDQYPLYLYLPTVVGQTNRGSPILTLSFTGSNLPY
jgi:hypothetical protein